MLAVNSHILNRWAVVGREVSINPGLAMFKTFSHPLIVVA
jgi:hypothetical protein